MERRATPVYFTPAGIAGTVAAFLVALVCIRLGLWQLDRRQQRRAWNAAVAARMHAPPPALLGPGIDTTGLLFRPVELAGTYDHLRSILRPGMTRNGIRGVHLFTPLRLPGGAAVLVNRGWLPSRDGITADLAPFSEPGPVRVRGLVLPIPATPPRSEPRPARLAANTFPRVWHRLDPERLARHLPYPVLGFYVQQLPEPGAPKLPARLDPPRLDDGPHLGYAIQWFSFATIAIAGWGALVLRRGEGRPRRTEE